MARLQPKTKEKVKHKNLYGNFTMEVDGNYLKVQCLISRRLLSFRL